MKRYSVGSDIPMPTVSRMATYLGCLASLEQQRVSAVSSRELAQLAGVSPEQVRQDLALFGRFGKRGSGYDVARLREEVESIFRVDGERWVCCMVGAGSLGTALISSRMTQRWGFRYAAAFDSDVHKVGVHIGRVPVYHINDAKTVIRRERVEIGVIAVPASSAQAVAGLLCDAGVLGIVNFAPVNIKVPQKTPVIPVDISQEFLKLAFCIQRARRREQEERLQIEAASGAD